MKTVLVSHRAGLSRIILVSGALIYLVFGTVFLLFPDIITAMDGIVLPDRAAANHIRAVYGGMEIGLGILLLYFCFAKDGVKNGLIVLLCSIGMASLSRLFGIIFDQGGNLSTS